MNITDIERNAVTVEERSLGELQRWLEYGKHTWSAGAGMIWLFGWIIAQALKIIALIFTPYMLWHLFRAKWYTSVVVLLVMVVLPFVAFQFIKAENEVLNFIFALFPLLAFYVYTYIISYMIGEELNKLRTLREWERESNKSL